MIVPALALCALGSGSGRHAHATGAQAIPAPIRQILDKPLYRNAVWGLRVIDLGTGEVLYDIGSDRRYLIGSVRKLYSVGLALDTLGPDHVFRTPVYRQGTVDADGTLAGNLILVASGDLAMGGRTNPDGSYAITNLDHNEANALGNAQLTAPDPLAGYRALAAQVAASGVKRITGDVVIDDRLFQPFHFRGEFDVRPIFVNDDVVDVIVHRDALAGRPPIDWRPKSAALRVRSHLSMTAAGTPTDIALEPELPACIGRAGCIGTVAGTLAADYIPPLTGQFPLIRTFRITQPANYARTVFIEALRRAGVAVDAPAVAPNPTRLLPARGAYGTRDRVAELQSLPYRDYVKHILKVSYNIGADTSLMLFGVAKGVDTLDAALTAERGALGSEFDIAAGDIRFVDGSGGGDTMAANRATIRMLQGMTGRPAFAAYFDALPKLGVDGSLAMVTDFAADPALAGAKGRVHAKTGTFVEGGPRGPVLKAQALAGYIDTKSGRRLAFTMAVNDVGAISDIADVLTVFQDQGTISAILWSAQ